MQSRYYDPEVGRFINADAFTSTGQGILGNNMFAYCNNNPVSNVDPTGHALMQMSFDPSGASSMLRPGQWGGGSGGVAHGGSVVSCVLLLGGVLICKGISAIADIAIPAPSISATKSEEKAEAIAIAIAAETDDPVYFPINPNDFNPVGLIKVPRTGTTNGAFISWMDPLTNTEVFRWDENPNYPNGPHYHINDPIYRIAKVHFYPGAIVPEPYATIYFPFR